MKAQVPDVPLRMAWLGLAALVASLLLPSVRLTVMGGPMELSGWIAVYCAAALGSEVAWNLVTGVAGQHAAQVLPAVACVLNLVFVMTPVLMARGALTPGRLRALAAAALAGLLLALASPFALAGSSPSVLAGYFVWLLAYGALLASLVLARRAAPARA
jgi:hypothetical protein